MPPDNQSAFVSLKRDFYQNSSDVVQSDVPLVLCRWLDGAIRKEMVILSGLPHLSLIHGWPVALGATARPTKPAAAARSREEEELSSNPFSVIGRRGSRTPSWSWLRGWSSGRGPLFCRGRRGRPPQADQAQARRITLRGCAVADRARFSVTTEAAELWSRAGSSTAVLNASAVTAPTPGTVIRRRHTWSCLATASPALSSNACWLMTAARVCDHAPNPLRSNSAQIGPARPPPLLSAQQSWPPRLQTSGAPSHAAGRLMAARPSARSPALRR
jgi:hypothetical protein